MNSEKRKDVKEHTTIDLAHERKVVDLLLSQKIGFNNLSDEGKIDLVCTVIDEIKRLKNSRLQEELKALVSAFWDVQLPQDKQGGRLTQILKHYRVNVLGNDEELVASFEEARKRYQQKPQDYEVCLQFGWVLYDCLKVACERLRHIKLTQFFKQEFETLQINGDSDQANIYKNKIERFEMSRSYILEKAKTFLSGPCEALAYEANEEWEQALLAGKRYLKSEPLNVEAYRICIDAGLHLESLQRYFEVFELCQIAMKRFPEQKVFQEKYFEILSFIYKACKTYEDKDDSSAILVVTSCVTALRAIKEGVGAYIDIEPTAKDYSRILRCATFLLELVFKHQKVEVIAEQLCVTAQTYLDIVQQWGLQNFKREDYEMPNKTKFLSLSARVSLALLRAMETLIKHLKMRKDEPFVSSVLQFVIQNSKLLEQDSTKYYHALASWYYCIENVETSRKYAFQLVCCKHFEGWRWNVLARTYAKDTPERKICFEQAKKLAQAQTLKVSSHELKLNVLAFDLLSKEATPVEGNVLAWFTKSDGIEEIRVGWNDVTTGAPLQDVVRASHVEGMNKVSPGMPINVFQLKCGDRIRAIKITPRPTGVMWDKCPLVPGIVVARDDRRHYLKVMYGAGKICSIDMKKLPISQKLKVAMFCELVVVERKEAAPLALELRVLEVEHLSELPFWRTYEGAIERSRDRREGWVADVTIPQILCRGLKPATNVSGIAVDLRNKASSIPHWSAITCTRI